MAQLKQGVKEKYDAILCRHVDTDTAQEMEVVAKEIPIVFFNARPSNDLLVPNRFIYVGSSELTAGKYQAEHILDKLSYLDEMNVMILRGENGNSAAQERTLALEETLKKSDKK